MGPGGGGNGCLKASQEELQTAKDAEKGRISLSWGQTSPPIIQYKRVSLKSYTHAQQKQPQEVLFL